MNVDRILAAFNGRQVEYLLIGGMNFLLRHAPITTFDIDIWIEDSDANRSRCELALADLDAEWGAANADWGPVAQRRAGWLGQQSLFCLNSPHGAMDVFRTVRGLGDWHDARQRALAERTAGGVAYFGLSDGDMLQCQRALDPTDQKQDRIKTLQSKLGQQP